MQILFTKHKDHNLSLVIGCSMVHTETVWVKYHAYSWFQESVGNEAFLTQHHRECT